MNLQQIPFIAAFVETYTPLGIANELKLRRLQLEIFHVKPLIHAACIEEKLMGRDGKQGACQLPDTRLVEVLQVLRGQNQGGFLLPHPLQAVADVLYSGEIAQPYIQLIQSRHGIALAKKLVTEEGQYIEQHGILYTAIGLEKSLYTEHQETRACDVGVTIEELSLIHI